MPQCPQRFAAHLRESDRAPQWVSEADSFIEAALRFVELADLSDEEDLAIVVTECETGQRRCIVVNMATGLVRSC